MRGEEERNDERESFLDVISQEAEWSRRDHIAGRVGSPQQFCLSDEIQASFSGPLARDSHKLCGIRALVWPPHVINRPGQRRCAAVTLPKCRRNRVSCS